jgi:hypothetical protein
VDGPPLAGGSLERALGQGAGHSDFTNSPVRSIAWARGSQRGSEGHTLQAVGALVGILGAAGAGGGLGWARWPVGVGSHRGPEVQDIYLEVRATGNMDHRPIDMYIYPYTRLAPK